MIWSTTGMAKWWGRSPPTNVFWVQFPDPASYVGSREYLLVSLWVEFVVGSFPCPKRFFSGYYDFPLSSKTNISKFQFDLDYCQALYHEPLARVIAQALPVFDIKFTFTFTMNWIRSISSSCLAFKLWPNGDASWRKLKTWVNLRQRLARACAHLRWLAMTCAHFGRDQICVQVDASFSPFGHPTQVDASWVTSINLLLASKIEDSLP